MRNNEILNAIWEGLDNDLVLEDLSIFLNWIVTKSRRYALANYFLGMPGLDLDPNGDTYLRDLLGRPVKKVIRELFDTRETLRVSTGMSCLNSALSVPEDVLMGMRSIRFSTGQGASGPVSSATFPPPTCGEIRNTRSTSLSCSRSRGTYIGTIRTRCWRRRILCSSPA